MQSRIFFTHISILDIIAEIIDVPRLIHESSIEMLGTIDLTNLNIKYRKNANAKYTMSKNNPFFFVYAFFIFMYV